MIKLINYKFFLLIIFLTIFIFYFLNISNNKGVILLPNNHKETTSSNSSSTFTNIEYNFVTSEGREYTLKGEQAFVRNNNLELVNLVGVKANTILNDKTVLNINSKYSDFYKQKKDIFFYENFVLKNKNIIVTANNANYFFKKNTIKIFGNVILKDGKNLIKCDNLNYDLNNKNIELNMNSKKIQVYGKKTKN
jgi:LPS export ABC transporter protein LptC